MTPANLFLAVLRQWGVETAGMEPSSKELAKRVADIKGTGNLVVTHEDGDTLTVPCKSMFEASNHVLHGLAMLSMEALLERDARFITTLTPAMFQWVPHKRDVLATPDADAVIARVKESM